jgi:hypothetical protein
MLMQEESDRERLKAVEQEMIQRELEATEQQLQVIEIYQIDTKYMIHLYRLFFTKATIRVDF